MARVAAFAVLAALAVFARTVAAGGPETPARACELRVYDADGRPIDAATSQISLTRTLPVGEGSLPPRDVDAVTWVAACTGPTPAESVALDSLRPDGGVLDALRGLLLHPGPCPEGVASGRVCSRTDAIRATVDFVDRAYPAVAARSLLAEVGGRLVASTAGGAVLSIVVGGPRDAPYADRHRGTLRFHVVRASRGGDAAIGGDDDGARRRARAEARIASSLWGQCGVVFGPEASALVDVVDPPPPYLLAIGCEAGLPATGGGRVTVAAGAKTVTVSTRPGDAPIVVAYAVSRAFRAAGFVADVSPNARVASGALPTADVLVRDRSGGLVRLSPASGARLSSDATLGVCLGDVALGDGLAHFEDADSAAGTLEERTLVKAYADDDPTTIDVFVIPSFSRTGRIGESFIDTDGSGIQNVVIIDRGAVRAGGRSYALAHELGHVLLDLPGHPDDFGVDRPSELMDADAADATVFGPRRLSREDCARAILQSGPGARSPLLRPWPLHPRAAKSNE